MFRNITNQKITDYINSFYEPLSSELGELRKQAEEDNVPIILKDSEALLVSLLNIKRPVKILEVGTAIGYSALVMSAALPDAEIYTVERDEEIHAKAVTNVNKFGKSGQIVLLKGDATEEILKLAELENPPSFDFIFIDAGKSKYKEFFDAALKLADKNAMIVCDNMLFKGRIASEEYDEGKKYKTTIRKMREFLDYLYSLDGYHTSYLSVGDGVTITTKQL